MTGIDLQALDKHYPGEPGSFIQAVHNLDLEIFPGELLALVGPTGCGKSTLLRLIAGLESPDSGKIRIAGREVNRLSPDLRGVGFVPQNPALLPHLRVCENLELPLKLRGFPKCHRRNRIEETARNLEIFPLLERFPHNLSGGEMQRAVLAAALVACPRILLLDEPLSSLDPGIRLQLRKEILRLQRSLNLTMVFVTHDQREAMTMGQRLAVMQNGRIRQLADPARLYQSPRDTFVAGFIGTPPMNVVAAGVRVIPETSPSVVLPNSSPAPETRFPAPIAWIHRLPNTTTTKITDNTIPVILGWHAESLHLTPPIPSDAWRLTAQVEMIEYLGHESIVHLASGSLPFQVRQSLPSHYVPHLGKSVDLFLPPQYAFLFHPETGALLSLPTAPRANSWMS